MSSTEMIITLSSFMYSALVVSAVNCLAYRMPRKIDWVRKRSSCELCGHNLHFWEVIPVVSSIITLGVCSHCKARYGFHHLISECLGGSIGITVSLVIISNKNWLVTTIALLTVLAMLTCYTLIKIKKEIKML